MVIDLRRSAAIGTIVVGTVVLVAQLLWLGEFSQSFVRKPGLEDTPCGYPPPPQAAARLAVVTAQAPVPGAVTLVPGRPTGLIDIHIAEASRPLYLILASQHPVIWRFSGQVALIEHVVATHVELPVGVAGLPAERISFNESARCALSSAWHAHAGRQGIEADARLLFQKDDGVDRGPVWQFPLVGGPGLDVVRVTNRDRDTRVQLLRSEARAVKPLTVEEVITNGAAPRPWTPGG